MLLRISQRKSHCALIMMSGVSMQFLIVAVKTKMDVINKKDEVFLELYDCKCGNAAIIVCMGIMLFLWFQSGMIVCFFVEGEKSDSQRLNKSQTNAKAFIKASLDKEPTPEGREITKQKVLPLRNSDESMEKNQEHQSMKQRLV